MNIISTVPRKGFINALKEREPLRPICAADIISRLPEWIWFPYIPKGMVTILEGEPDQGKSWITCSIASHISNGTPLPGQKHTSPPQKVLMMTQEDDLGVTMRPRLEALGANLSNIFLLDKNFTLDEWGLAQIDTLMRSMVITILVLDPMTKYMGGKIDMYRPNETDMVMSPLVQAARDTECAILLVRHLRKSKSGNAKDNGIGSINILGSARSVVQVSQLANGTKVMTHIKHNISAQGPSLTYSTEGNTFKWGEELGMEDSAVQKKVSTNPRAYGAEKARAFLRTTLKDGPVWVAEVLARGADEGISKITLERAKVGVVVSQKDGQKWVWRLVEDEQVEGDQEAGSGCGEDRGDVQHSPVISEGVAGTNGVGDEEEGGPTREGGELSPELQALLDTMNAKLATTQRAVN